MEICVRPLIIDATEPTTFGRRTADTRSLLRHQRGGAELNCVHLHVRLCNVIEIGLVPGVTARVVHTVSQKYYRFSSRDAGHFPIKGKIDPVVQPRAPASLDIGNGLSQLFLVVGWSSQCLNVIGERNNKSSIVGAHLIDQSDCRILYVSDLKNCGVTVVDQQRYSKRPIDRGKISELLLNAVFEYMKILAAQCGHVL